MFFEFSKEVKQAVDNARIRLHVTGLTDAELVEQVKVAQRHNPKTGHSMDPDAAFVLAEEIRNRQIAAAQVHQEVDRQIG